ncbi:DUF1836 domain-containing protein [Oceanobacillus massiliensis]|uniref:DUF1836 domain-containing protein n=1 Tax=Oceanobacillus massiliensis TaxID=1465765 RepID=UPI003017AEDF
MKNKKELMEALHLDNQLTLEDMPDLDLYMDQVIQLFENKYASSKRNEKEKVLTKTMVNNYAKGKLFFPIKDKKYSKEHMILISMIYQMKSTLSISDVKQTLNQLNSGITEENLDLKQLYQTYLDLMQNNTAMFTRDIEEQIEAVRSEAEQLENADEEYLEQLLLVATFSSMSNYYRRAAEMMVDKIGKKGEDKHEA